MVDGRVIAIPEAWTLGWVALAYVGPSLLLLGLYGWDKRAARLGRQRVPEKRLQLLALIGGWPGGWLGQQLFRHKTRKLKFLLVFWLMALINLCGLIWLLWMLRLDWFRPLIGYLEQ